MTIIRELVTKLSFEVDRRGIENFNRSIIGFKTKFALATTAVTGFVTGVVKAISAVADTVLDTNELARSVGIATEELVGLQRAAQQFRISPDQFNAALTNLNQLIRESQQGFGTLQRLARDGAFEIRGADQSLLSTRQILENIIEALGRVEDEASRRDLSKQIFGNERFAEIAKQGVERLKELSSEFRPLGEEISKAEEQAKKFDSSLTRLIEKSKEFAFQAFPPLFNFVGDLFEEVNDEINSFKKGTFFEDLFRKIGEEAAAFDRSLGINNTFGLQNTGLAEPITRQINMRNSINITVPPGTEESQAQFIKRGVDEAVDDAFQRNFEKIGNNFPETE